MSRTPRLATQAWATRQLGDAFHYRLLPALDAMAVRLADGYPGGHVGSGEGLTPVEAAVTQRWKTDLDHAELERIVTAIAGLYHSGLDIIQRYERPSPDAVRQARCTGGVSDSGGIEWGRPECDNIASRKGLCDACRKRKDRWERRVA